MIALSRLGLAFLGAWWLEPEPFHPQKAGTPTRSLGNITTGYAITYIFGLAGQISIVKLMPGMLKIDLKAEAKKSGAPA